MRSASPLATLAARSVENDPPISEYAHGLVRDVAEHLPRIDVFIADHAEGWTLERMPAVDRNILRIAVLEMVWRDDVPDRVAIDEAVELAKTVSTDRSPAFVNGLLASLLSVKPAAD